jgi:hypothetical protein
LSITAAVRDAFSLNAIGIVHYILMCAEHIVIRQVKRVEEAIKNVFMALKFTISVNMLNFETKCLKMARYQDGAVACKWLLFSTHKRNTILLSAFLESIHAITKEISPRKSVVLNFSVVVTGGIFAPRSELPAEEYISNVMIAQGRLQVFPVELRVGTAVGLRAHIAKSCNTVQLQEGKEVLQSVRGMSDCENCLLHTLLPHNGCSLRTVATSL